MKVYDAIVVGARCAGAATAMLLARKGLDVLLVDKAVFPRDIPHGHFVHRGGPLRLARWGLLDRVVATGCPAIRSITTDFGDGAVTGTDLEVDGVAAAYGPRRSVLDRILVEAAVEAGAELREGFAVDGVIVDGDHVGGIRGHDVGCAGPVAEHARVTIGADGRNSRIARAVGAPIAEATPPLTCWYFAYWSGVPDRGLEVYAREGRVVFAFPTNDGLFAIFVGWPATELPVVRSDIDGRFMAAVDAIPALAERVREGRRVERFRGATDVPNFLRVPAGSGWALVGDAGCHKDPFLALGICDAFRDAELLADAVGAGLSGRQPLADTLAEYGRQRDAATLADYRRNIEMARLRPLPPDQLRLRAALRGDQAATIRFYLASEGLVPAETFFNPENLGRLLAA
jgi:flavin-dependent dehydrogenase